MKFISDGTWFDKWTEVEILEEIATVYDSDGTPTLSVLARGLREGSTDEELCTMDEFIVVGDNYEDKKNESK